VAKSKQAEERRFEWNQKEVKLKFAARCSFGLETKVTFKLRVEFQVQDFKSSFHERFKITQVGVLLFYVK
jgi:hypothetical protein